MKFDWTAECEVAFCEVKRRLVSAPVLHPPDLTKPFQLWTDACERGFGAVLEQKTVEGDRHPIAYASRATNEAEHKYAPTELEVAALVFALEHFQVYLLGNKVTVYTDHQALVSSFVTQSDKTSLIARKYTHVYNVIYLLFCVCYSNSVSFIELLRSFWIHGGVCAKILCSEKELLNLQDSKLTRNFYGNKTGFVRPGHIYTVSEEPDQGPWYLRLSPYLPNITLEHKPGSVNRAADALSRAPANNAREEASPVTGVLRIESETEDPLVTRIRSQQCESKELAQLILYLEKKTLPEDPGEVKEVVTQCQKGFYLLDGVLYYENSAVSGRRRIVVPEHLQKEVLSENHEAVFAGHFSPKRMFNKLSQYYYWQGMRGDIQNVCETCIVCASTQGQERRKKPLLHCIPVGEPFECVAMDFKEMDTSTDGNRYICPGFPGLPYEVARSFPSEGQVCNNCGHMLS